MTPLEFRVHGTPAPQGSKNGFLHPHTGRVIITDKNPKQLRTWRQEVRTAALTAISHHPDWQPFTGPVRVLITFYMPRPKAHFRTGKYANELRHDAPRWVDKKPDSDKLLRSVLDALTEALVYRDDSQVASEGVDQLYVTHEPPGASIVVTSLAHVNRVIPATATPQEQGVLL